MADYVTEISNPAFKQETEEYLAQLEAQKELPAGKALIRPSAGFVVKCQKKKKKTCNSADDTSKLFLNVVHSKRVAEPTNQKSELAGADWLEPYAIGPIRMEQDRGKNLVATIDCCFHPASLRYAHARKDFLILVIDIAKDAATNTFQKSGDDVLILPGYTILRGVSYKSGETPKALVIASDFSSELEARA